MAQVIISFTANDSSGMVSGYPTEVDTEILIAVNRFSYLTAEQLARLRYPHLADHRVV